MAPALRLAQVPQHALSSPAVPASLSASPSLLPGQAVIKVTKGEDEEEV